MIVDDKRCDSCPQEVEWRRIRFQPLFRIMEYISFQPDGRMIVPNHLDQDGIRQFEIIIDYRLDATKEEIDLALEDSGIDWESMNYPRGKIWGGSVFKIPGKKGYWVLRAPCLYCYGKIASENETKLVRCAIMAYL